MTATTTDTSATLSWGPPISNGGLEDVFYLIRYKTSEEEQFNYYSPTPPITGTSATVTSLTPLTIYIFMAVAENGITQEFPDLFTERVIVQVQPYLLSPRKAVSISKL